MFRMFPQHCVGHRKCENFAFDFFSFICTPHALSHALNSYVQPKWSQFIRLSRSIDNELWAREPYNFNNEMPNNIFEVSFSLMRETHTHLNRLNEKCNFFLCCCFFYGLLQFDDCSLLSTSMSSSTLVATFCSRAAICATVGVHLFEFNGHFPSGPLLIEHFSVRFPLQMETNQFKCECWCASCMFVWNRWWIVWRLSRIFGATDETELEMSWVKRSKYKLWCNRRFSEPTMCDARSGLSLYSIFDQPIVRVLEEIYKSEKVSVWFARRPNATLFVVQFEL